VTKGLKRFYGDHDLHFITGSCYRRRPELGSAYRRDLFLRLLEQVRQKYQFVVYGYVVMPEHFHLLINEPEKGNPSIVMKVVKERFTRLLNRKRRSSRAQALQWNIPCSPVWQKRFYDFNVWSRRKRVEKLRYLHRNPVKRGLVAQPEGWKWSSYRSYAYGEPGAPRLAFSRRGRGSQNFTKSLQVTCCIAQASKPRDLGHPAGSLLLTLLRLRVRVRLANKGGIGSG